MKCIQCGTDNNLKDRTNNQGRCINCQHSFAFEPTTMGTVKVTDPMFAKAIADISANGTLFFTPKQLLYLLENRLRRRTASPGCLFIFFFVFMNIWAPGFFGGFLSMATGNRWLPFVLVSVVTNLIFITHLLRLSQSSKLNYHDRRENAKYLRIAGGLILVIGILGSLFLWKSYILFVISVLLGMSALYLGARQLAKQAAIPQTFLTSPQVFQHWLATWQRHNPAIDKLLPPPRETNPNPSVNSEITAYSFDRLVVCDHAEIAQLLIANNFHFENNCAILSITGYPESIFETTMTMLRRNPDLRVYAIHSCTPRGIQLAYHLRTSPQWFQNSQISIIDVGLLPRQIIANKDMFVQNSIEMVQAARQIPSEVRQELSASELAWLEAGNFVELESFSPRRIIHVLNHGIAGSRDLGSDESGLILVGDSSNYIYASDNFG
ncbi:hypothetical protein K9N68_28215 [Kovacikia minuta CCNUW1]|uniref:hypothetical protein n=1 Tax=Kovacikia minuta TaxID=2931930 RepID=UPI001CCB01D5|nr:hypothetical protein [Kovacikia minuta]UBF25438.1 hypothetical protein K9N68_28215 [Kovacikia minuta CCNUW1]